jgi:hypothetical protein
MIRDYESFEYWPRGTKPVLLEVYSGQEIVGWHGRIERQIMDDIEEYEAARNPGYADKLRAFLQIWRQHPLTGSINVETVDSLLSATEFAAVDPWKMQKYFSNLRDQLRMLKASVEELPVDAFSAAHSGPTPPMGPPPGAPPEEPAPAEEKPEAPGAPPEEPAA